MRRDAPVYYDETSDVWGISRYDDVLAHREGPGDVLEHAGAAARTASRCR